MAAAVPGALRPLLLQPPSPGASMVPHGAGQRLVWPRPGHAPCGTAARCLRRPESPRRLSASSFLVGQPVLSLVPGWLWLSGGTRCRSVGFEGEGRGVSG